MPQGSSAVRPTNGLYLTLPFTFNYFIIHFGYAAAYRVYVYMLHPLQGSRSKLVDLLHSLVCNKLSMMPCNLEDGWNTLKREAADSSKTMEQSVSRHCTMCLINCNLVI